MPSVQLRQSQCELIAQLLCSPSAVSTAAAASNDLTDAPQPTPAQVPILGAEETVTQRNIGEALRVRFEAQQQSAAWLKMQQGRSKLPALAAAESLMRCVTDHDGPTVHLRRTRAARSHARAAPCAARSAPRPPLA